MKTLTKSLRPRWRTGLLAAALAAAVGGATLAPAFADDGHHGDRDHHAQEWRGGVRHDRDWHADRGAIYVAPGYNGYAYAPAPGYGYSYAPAPVYPAPGLSLGFVFR